MRAYFAVLPRNDIIITIYDPIIAHRPVHTSPSDPLEISRWLRELDIEYGAVGEI